MASPLWKVEVQSQHTRNNAINENIETCSAEAAFDERRRAVLGVLGFDAERATVTSGRYACNHIGPLVERLLELPDLVVMEVAAEVMVGRLIRLAMLQSPDQLLGDSLKASLLMRLLK